MDRGFERLRATALAAGVAATVVGGVAGRAEAAPQALPFSVTTGHLKAVQFGNSVQGATTPVGFGLVTAELLTAAGTKIDPVDGCFNLELIHDGYAAPAGTVDHTANTVTSSGSNLHGVGVTVKYFVFPTKPVIRALFSFTNPGSAEVGLSVTQDCNLGSDAHTTVLGSSNRNKKAESSDRWFATSDGTAAHDPPLTFGRGRGGHLIGAPGRASLGERLDAIYDNYEVQLAPGETKSLVFFLEINATPKQAVRSGRQFGSMRTLRKAHLLTGLSSDELRAIQNY